MTAGLWNFSIEQGATFQRTVMWEDEDGPVDPSGYEVTMQIRGTNDELLVDLSSAEGGGIELDTVGRLMTIEISAEDTALLNFKRGYYDLKFVHPSGPTIRLLQGVANVSEAVTR